MIAIPEYQLFQVIPDRLVENAGTNILCEALHAMYSPPSSRLSKAQYKLPNTWGWEISISHSSIRFFLRAPSDWQDYIKQKVEACWPKVTLKPATDWADSLVSPIGAYLRLRNHFFLSLDTDKRKSAPLTGLLETSRFMNDGDTAAVQYLFAPESPDWYMSCLQALNDFKNGRMPQRHAVTGGRMAREAIKFIANAGLEIAAIVTELITDKDAEPEYVHDTEQMVLEHDKLSDATLRKARYRAYEPTIRLVAESKDPARAKCILQGLMTSYQELAGDNELVAGEKKEGKEWLEFIRNRVMPVYKVNKDYLSSAEVGRLIQLPTATLQEEFPQTEKTERREVILNELFTKKGILLGTYHYKDKKTEVYWPTNNHDELCLPRVVIGGMGTGKTEGFGAGFAVEALMKGHSVFAIDVAEGRLCTLIRDCLPPSFPADRIIDMNFGNLEWPIPLNWSEVGGHLLSNRMLANTLSNQLVGYINKYSSEVMGERTRRYAKLAAQTVYEDPQATVLDVVLMLCGERFRAEKMKGIKSLRIKESWEIYHKMSNSMQTQITQPVLNRMTRLLEEDIVANSVCQPPKLNKAGRPLIDFRKWLDGGYAVLLRVPKSILLEEPTDAIVTYLIAKIWLSTLTRCDQPIEARKPAFLIMDEPHQFLSAAQEWKNMVVESRKWRLGLVFMFHSWEHLPKDLIKIVKAAGPHYTLYSSSKDTFKELQEEIVPFTVEDGLALPRHWAINMVRAGGEYHKFLAHMISPPDRRQEVIDRQGLETITHQIYGRHVEEVERLVLEREKLLL